MLVYCVTFSIVFFLAGLAAYYDYPKTGELCWGRVKHSSAALTFYLIASLVLIVVGGLRYSVGADFGAYYQLYNDWDDLLARLTGFDEPGFYLIAYLATSIFHDPLATTFIALAITEGIMLFVVYRNTDDLFLGLTFLVLLGCWVGAFNGIRQYMAVSFLFLGYPYLRDRKFVPYLLCVLLACCFHRSAAIMILIYPIAHRCINLRNTLQLIILGVIVLFSYEQVLKLAGWILNSDVATKSVGDAGYSYIANSVSLPRTLAGCAPAVFALAYYWNKHKDKKLTFAINLTLVYALLRIASMGSAFLGRIAIYGTPFLALALVELLKPLPPRSRRLATLVVFLLYLAFELYEVSNSVSLCTWHWAVDLF